MAETQGTQESQGTQTDDLCKKAEIDEKEKTEKEYVLDEIVTIWADGGTIKIIKTDLMPFGHFRPYLNACSYRKLSIDIGVEEDVEIVHELLCFVKSQKTPQNITEVLTLMEKWNYKSGTLYSMFDNIPALGLIPDVKSEYFRPTIRTVLAINKISSSDDCRRQHREHFRVLPNHVLLLIFKVLAEL